MPVNGTFAKCFRGIRAHKLTGQATSALPIGPRFREITARTAG